ncbi:NAD kinase [Nocardioides insulae]|uniref:NAD kinase n=1 Tax=Nocardioides insulae TaxID=394734 RepID=UPI000400DB6D|nr:NAD kinase [Nocardioides insulae]
MSTPPPPEQDPDRAEGRRVLVLTHTGRPEARAVALAFCEALTGHGMTVRVPAQEAVDLGMDPAGYDPPIELTELGDSPGGGQDDVHPTLGCELVLVLGGDGTILRAAELTHGCGTPVLGVNLGHVGFLAEAEHDDVESVIHAIVHRRYTAEDRLTLEVCVFRDGEEVFRTFALNEATVEKGARERMLELVVEIDGRPLSRWGCDGVVCATPTGSTAYSFSAGGPVVWPGVEALVMVPISAHALFARPMVVAPTSRLAIEVIARPDGAGVLWADGRRAVELPTGARIEVTRGKTPVRLVRLHEAPFTDRLVAKFGLSVEGWRGAAERRREARKGGTRA